MVAQLCRTLTCFAVLTSVMLWTPLPFSPPPASAQVTRWARFELHQQDSAGDLQSLWVAPWDNHPNARGHKLLADALERAFREPIGREMLRPRSEAQIQPTQ